VAPPDAPILLFDGVCNLCDASVQWVIRHDRAAQFRFASLQSPAGRELLARHDLPVDALETVVLVEGDRHWLRSDAGIEVIRRLGGWWAFLALELQFLPRFLRDGVYRFIARNRYRWFGRKDACLVPTPELAARFLS
jgi:predicted DCC family thiol-disulfide oxidoreductase YuxK